MDAPLKLDDLGVDEEVVSTVQKHLETRTNDMSSDQKAVIALINRSMLLIRELNETRRMNRALEQRLSESQDRVIALEAQLGAKPDSLRAA